MSKYKFIQEFILSFREKSISLFKAKKNAQLPKRDFTQKLARALQDNFSDRKVIVEGELKLKITKNNSSLSCDLGNLYGDCLLYSDKQDPLIEQYILGVIDNFNEIEDSKGRLDPQRIVPIIKTNRWLESVRQSHPEMLVTYDELNDDLIVLYAVDTEENMLYHGADEFEKIGLSGHELREVAVKNLRRIVPEMKVEQITLDAGIAPDELNVYKLHADGYYDTSLLLFDEIWSSGMIPVNGDLVVAVPARGELFVAGSEDYIGVSMLTHMAKRISEIKNYPLIDTLLVYRDKRFQPFTRSLE